MSRILIIAPGRETVRIDNIIIINNGYFFINDLFFLYGHTNLRSDIRAAPGLLRICYRAGRPAFGPFIQETNYNLRINKLFRDIFYNSDEVLARKEKTAKRGKDTGITLRKIYPACRGTGSGLSSHPLPVPSPRLLSFPYENPCDERTPFSLFR